mmetsp:Transcript_24965/g.60106  ORF Transcript_24965/g.60106 Transcript_24965/m.60106 type:complete len:83 (-) Transcript_24965:17-265(-)
MASATSGGGGARSHRLRKQPDAEGAEGGSREGIRGGMDGSDMRPSCVAVSRCIGRVIVAGDACASYSESHDDADDDATTAKS